jgi:hypothetical protein
MNAEAGAENCAMQDNAGFHPGRSGAKIATLKNAAEAAMARVEITTFVDWAALKREIHQKLQELKQSDGCWRQAKSDLEARIAVLDESIKSSNPSSVNIFGNLRRSEPPKERSSCWAGGVRTNAL